MNKTQGTALLKIAILALAFIAQANTIASVMMADIAAAFPTASPTAIQYVMQFGMIGGFPVSLACGFLSRKFRKKPMLLIGVAAIAIGGILPIVNHSSLAVLYASAAIIGAGQGFMLPLLGEIVLSTFQGKEKDTMLGLQTTFSTGGSAALLMLAGPVCLSGWVNTFYIYLVAVPVLLIVFFCMPMGEKPQPLPAAAGGSKAMVPAKAWIQTFMACVGIIANVAFPLNVGMFIAAEGLGNAADTGLTMTMVTIMGALVGLVFPFVVRSAKLYITSLSYAAGLIGMVLVASATSMMMVYAGAVFLGLFFGLAGAGAGYVVGRICKPEQIGPTFSVSMSFITLGVILSPMVVNTVTGMWGELVPRNCFITSAVIFGAVLVFSVFWNAYLTKSCPEQAPAGAAQA